jgi:hypothetical protein
MNLAPGAPTRPRVVQFYSRHYYTDRVKPIFDQKWQAIIDSVGSDEAPPAKIKIRNEITKSCWLLETAGFRAEVEAAMLKEHEHRKRMHTDLLKEVPDRTAEDYKL